MAYLVRDLMINVLSAGGSTSLPADDTTPVPTPITPVAINAAVLAVTPQIEFTGALVKHALKDRAGSPHSEALASAAFGGPAGSAAFVQFNRNLAEAVVGAAVLQFGGGAGMPNPDCGGSSMETIPTPITPVVSVAKGALQASHLPALKQKLTAMLGAVEAAEKTLRPSGRAASELAENLQGAAAELKGAAAKAKA